MVELFGKKDEKKGGDLPDLPKPPAFSPSTPSPMNAPPSFGPQTSLSAPPSAPSLGDSPAVPKPLTGVGGSQELLTEDIEKIAESIVDDKWNRVKDELDSVTSWKTEIDTQVKEFKSQLEALDKKVSDAQNAMLGKVDEYNKSLQGVNVEIQAMGKVFEKVIPQFTDNVNRLSEMVGKKSAPKEEEI